MMQRLGSRITKASWSNAVTPPGECWRLAMKRGDVARCAGKVNTSLRFNASNPGDGVESAGISQQWAEEGAGWSLFSPPQRNTH